MSRSGYSDDFEYNWSMICYRGAVASATKGARGQAMLRDLLAALDALPEKRLITDELRTHEGVCALGALGAAKGMDMEELDPNDSESIGKAFNIADSLAREIVYENDERPWALHDGKYVKETPEQRWQRMRNWVAKLIVPV
jgi:hypothetical protein